MKKSNKGGRGKQEELRNRAIVILNEVEPETFSLGKLAELFGRGKTTIQQIVDREKANKTRT
jgi:hypothetical protein